MGAVIENAQLFLSIRQFIRDYGTSKLEVDSQVWKYNELETSVSFSLSNTEKIISQDLEVIFHHNNSDLEFYKGDVVDLHRLYNVISQRKKIKHMLKMEQH